MCSSQFRTIELDYVFVLDSTLASFSLGIFRERICFGRQSSFCSPHQIIHRLSIRVISCFTFLFELPSALSFYMACKKDFFHDLRLSLRHVSLFYKEIILRLSQTTQLSFCIVHINWQQNRRLAKNRGDLKRMDTCRAEHCEL